MTENQKKKFLWFLFVIWKIGDKVNSKQLFYPASKSSIEIKIEGGGVIKNLCGYFTAHLIFFVEIVKL